MFCAKSNQLLTKAAARYIQLGYTVGASLDKVLIEERFSPYISPKSWNSISIILDGLVCVDLDRFTSLGEKFVLPPTFKERSPRGLHFLYRLPVYFKGTSKIGWKKHIDLLTRTRAHTVKYGSSDKEFQGHVLCSPSKGYTRLSPNVIPRKMDLPMAPDWLLDNLQ